MTWLKLAMLRSAIRGLERELAQINRKIDDRSAVLQSPYRRRAQLEAQLEVARRRCRELEEAQPAAPGGAL